MLKLIHSGVILLLAISGQVLSNDQANTTGEIDSLSVDQQRISENKPSAFLHSSSLKWEMNEFPVHRWKTLVGIGADRQEGPEDIAFGQWELAPNAIYHGHKHEIPEIYYIVSGKALWTVGDETTEVSAGTAIYTKPGAVHKMVNLTDEVVKAVWIWWAPNGNTDVFESEYIFTEDAPEQSKNAGFRD